MGILGDPVQKEIDKYGLTNLTEKDLESVRAIIGHLAGSGFLDVHMKLSFGTKSEDLLQVAYLQSIFEQNWIIIRQLERIAKSLEE